MKLGIFIFPTNIPFIKPTAIPKMIAINIVRIKATVPFPKLSKKVL